MLLDNKLLWLRVPKNASYSIEFALYNSDLTIEEFTNEETFEVSKIRKNLKQLSENEKDKFDYFEYFPHIHYTLPQLKSKFDKNYKSFGVKRNSYERFISSIKFMVWICNQQKIQLKEDFTKMSTNDIILFLKPFITKINTETISEKILRRFSNDLNFSQSWIQFIISQYFWGLNECDLIFDIKEINNIEHFIFEETKQKITIKKLNDTKIINTNIIVNEELINFVDEYIDGVVLNKKIKQLI